MAADPPPSSPGPAAPVAPTSMLGLGAALGAQLWWCEQLFAVAGEWVPRTPEAAVRVHLAELSRVVGGHAVDLRTHLPRPTGTDAERWVAAPHTRSLEVVAALAALDGTVARLAGLHRALVPRLLVAWDAHRRDVGPAGRGLRRSIGHARHDLTDLWLDGEGLLQAAMVTEGAARGATEAVGTVEALLVATGGLIGPPPTAPPG